MGGGRQVTTTGTIDPSLQPLVRGSSSAILRQQQNNPLDPYFDRYPAETAGLSGNENLAAGMAGQMGGPSYLDTLALSGMFNLPALAGAGPTTGQVDPGTMLSPADAYGALYQPFQPADSYRSDRGQGDFGPDPGAIPGVTSPLNPNPFPGGGSPDPGGASSPQPQDPGTSGTGTVMQPSSFYGGTAGSGGLSPYVFDSTQGPAAERSFQSGGQTYRYGPHQQAHSDGSGLNPGMPAYAAEDWQRVNQQPVYDRGMFRDASGNLDQAGWDRFMATRGPDGSYAGPVPGGGQAAASGGMNTTRGLPAGARNLTGGATGSFSLPSAYEGPGNERMPPQPAPRPQPSPGSPRDPNTPRPPTPPRGTPAPPAPTLPPRDPNAEPPVGGPPSVPGPGTPPGATALGTGARLTGATRFDQSPGILAAGQRVRGEEVRNDPAVAAALQDFNLNIAPGISNEATLSGLGRSTAHTNALARSQASMLTPLYQNAFQREENRIDRGLGATESELARRERSSVRTADATAQQAQMLMGLSNQRYGQNMGQLGALLQTGGLQRENRQQGYDAQYNDMLRRQALIESNQMGVFGQTAPSAFGSRTLSSGGMFKAIAFLASLIPLLLV